MTFAKSYEVTARQDDILSPTPTPSGQGPRDHRKLYATGGALAVIAAIAGAFFTTHNSKTPAPAPKVVPSQAPAPSVDPAIAAASQVQDTIRRYEAALAAIRATPTDATIAALSKVSEGQDLEGITITSKQMQADGRHAVGAAPIVGPITVTNLHLPGTNDPSKATATATYCIDSRNGRELDKDGKDITSPLKANAYIYTQSLDNLTYPDPTGWKVFMGTSQNAAAC